MNKKPALSAGLLPAADMENQDRNTKRHPNKARCGSACDTEKPLCAPKNASQTALNEGVRRSGHSSVKSRSRSPKSASKKLVVEPVPYQQKYSEQLLAFFDVAPFKVTEVLKKDGSVSLLETAAELPTFAAFARSLGVTQSVLLQWEEEYPDFAEAAKKARDLQGDILIQNSLRGNYSASFAMFTAKNILGWSDGKNESSPAPLSVVVRWEKE